MENQLIGTMNLGLNLIRMIFNKTNMQIKRLPGQILGQVQIHQVVYIIVISRVMEILLELHQA